MQRMLERYLGRGLMAPDGADAGGGGGDGAGGAAAGAGEGAGGQGGAGAAGDKGAGASGSAANWRDGLDGELRTFADRLESPHDAVKSAFNLRKEISTRIKLPGKDAKPEDVSAYRKAVGAPEKADDYFQAADGESDTDKAVQAKVAEVLHKHHVPAAAAGELKAVVAELGQSIQAENDRVAIEARQNAHASLKKEWGADFEGNVELAARAAREFGGDEFLDFVSSTHINGQKLGDHPNFIKVFGKIGRRMGEGGFIGAVGTAERESVGQELDRLDREFYTAQARNDRPAMARLDKERLALREKLYGVEPIVGAGGRVA